MQPGIEPRSPGPLMKTLLTRFEYREIQKWMHVYKPEAILEQLVLSGNISLRTLLEKPLD